MEWTELRHVLLPVLDMLSLAWAGIWLVNRLVAGNLESVLSPDTEPAGMRQIHDAGLSVEELALLTSAPPPRPEPTRWM